MKVETLLEQFIGTPAKFFEWADEYSRTRQDDFQTLLKLPMTDTRVEFSFGKNLGNKTKPDNPQSFLGDSSVVAMQADRVDRCVITLKIEEFDTQADLERWDRLYSFLKSAGLFEPAKKTYFLDLNKVTPLPRPFKGTPENFSHKFTFFVNGMDPQTTFRMRVDEVTQTHTLIHFGDEGMVYAGQLSPGAGSQVRVKAEGDDLEIWNKIESSLEDEGWFGESQNEAKKNTSAETSTPPQQKTGKQPIEPTVTLVAVGEEAFREAWYQYKYDCDVFYGSGKGFTHKMLADKIGVNEQTAKNYYSGWKEKPST